MRIGILTYHCVPNFGAQLQTLSTMSYLRKAGHDPIVLNWYPHDLEEIYAKSIPQCQNHCQMDFAIQNFPLSKRCSTEKELIQEISDLKIDAIFEGSDALFKYVPLQWRWILKMGKYKPRLIHDAPPSVERLHGNPFFGGFIKRLAHNIPVSVYAVSSQNCPYRQMLAIERNVMKKSLDNFKLISVRDEWTRDMIKSIGVSQNIDIYPDPVFAFNQNAGDLVPSKKDMLTKYNLTDKYILISFRTGLCPDDYIQSLADTIEKNGYQPVSLTMPEGSNCGTLNKQISVPISPLDWYALIKYSSGYIGERMHPIIVCLHNAVPFFVFDEYGGNRYNKLIFPRPISYNETSSKIYLIVHDASFDNNWYSYYFAEERPSAEKILDLLENFSKSQCEKFALFKYDKYVEGMNNILKSFE